MTSRPYSQPAIARSLAVTLAVLAGMGTLIWAQRTPPRVPAQATGHHDKYQCPMHPQIVTDHPGDCPICHMKLEKVEEEGAAPATQAQKSQPKAAKYRNPMDPNIFSDHPMKDSMGMDYIPVYEDGPEAAGGELAGKAGFTLSPERQQLIGVRSAVAGVMPLAMTVRMPGRVASPGRISAQLLEIDAGSLRPGMQAQLRGPRGAVVGATVTGVGNGLDNLTHTFGVTLRAASAAAWIRPGLFCQVLVQVDLGKHLAVPLEAILDTGLHQALFVVDEHGHFDPRQVTLGVVGDDAVEVTQGLKAGEHVVTSANFLIDSESRFRAALEQFQGSTP